jgi:hypothetical protein
MLGALVASAPGGCNCTGGDCVGTLFDKERVGDLSGESASHDINPDGCVGSPTQVLLLDWDDADLSAEVALLPSIGVFDGEAQLKLLPEANRSEGVLDFRLAQGAPEVANLAIEFVVGGRWHGTLAMRDAEDATCKCTFDVPHDTEQDEGPDCTSSGDSDIDTD